MAVKDNIIYKNGGGVLQEAGSGRTEGKAENSYFRRIMVYFLGSVFSTGVHFLPLMCTCSRYMANQNQLRHT